LRNGTFNLKSDLKICFWIGQKERDLGLKK
jgi:hypothetical protein